METTSNPKSRSGISEGSKLVKRDVSHTTENENLEKQFGDTRRDIREGLLNRSIIPEVKHSGLDYTMINLSTIEDIDEEIMYKPLINVSVVGRIDNLKVSHLKLKMISTISATARKTGRRLRLIRRD